jgi:AraC-like DNA-binding protein
MLDIVALVTSSDARGRIMASIGRRATVRLATTPSELTTLVAHRLPSAVICEFGDQSVPATAQVVSELRARRPGLPMIGYCWVEAHASHHIIVAARAGVSALALRGVDDVGAMIDRVVEDAQGDIVAQMVTCVMRDRMPGIVSDVLDYCIRHAREMPRVGDVARGLQVPRRTLAHRLLQAGAPTVGALICWGRLFVAAELLVNDGRSVDGVALALEFASGSALRGMLQRYAKVTPRQLRARGGLPYLLAIFASPQGRPVQGGLEADLRIPSRTE